MPTQPPREPYGNTPLTTESLATLGHPLGVGDFNQDDQGRLWRTIRGEKTYYAPEWFDQSGTYVGTGGTDAAKAKEGVGEGFFKQGQKYNWTSGEWENPTNWANVIGTLAAGGVGAGIAAPFIAPVLAGGGGTASGTSSGLGLTSGLGTNATLGSVLGNPLVQGGIKTGIDAARGNLSWKDALNFIPAIPGAGNVGGLVTNNPIAKGAINAGVQSGVRSAATGNFDPTQLAIDVGVGGVGSIPAVKNLGGTITKNPIGKGAINAGVQSGLRSAKTGTFDPETFGIDVAGGAVPGVASSLTTNPIARRGLTAGLNLGLNTARTGQFNPVQAGVNAGRVLMPTTGTNTTTPTGTGMPRITRRNLADPGGGPLGIGYLSPTGFTGFEEAGDGGDEDFGSGGGDDTGATDDGGDTGSEDGGDFGSDGGDEGGDVLPSHPSPGQGTTLPPGSPGTHPSVGLPLPSTNTNDPNKPPATGGGFMDELTKLLSGPLGGLAGGFLSGLGQSLTQQKRQSFEGTAADPVKIMADLGPGLKGLIGGFQDRYNQGVSLPDAFVDLRSPVFTGGGTALPVGILPRGDAPIGRPAPPLMPGGGVGGITPKATVPDATSTQAPKQPGDTPGMQYPLSALDPTAKPMSDKDRALAALNLLGVS